MTKLTIFVLGPPQVGKTAISNYIADLSESLETAEYHPTAGVRILEFDRTLTPDPRKHKWRQTNIQGTLPLTQVEVWDVGGDARSMQLLSPLSHGIHGAVFVTSPDGKHDTDLDAWY